MGRFGRAAAWRNTATFGTRSWSPHKHNDGAAAGDASCAARPVPHPTRAPTPRPAPAHWTGRLGNPGTRLAARPARCGVDGGDQPRDVVSVYPGSTTTDIPSTFEGDHLMPRASLTTSAGGWRRSRPRHLVGLFRRDAPNARVQDQLLGSRRTVRTSRSADKNAEVATAFLLSTLLLDSPASPVGANGEARGGRADL
jgi:hypothetical protein